MALRVSSYIIPTEVDTDKYILVHGYSGAVDMVDSDVAAMLTAGDKANLSSLDEDTRATLLSRGYLTEKTRDEEIDYVARMARLLHRRSQLIYAAFTFAVTYDCNFRCPYCFERDSVAACGGNRTMTREVVDAAFKAIESVNAQRPRPSRHITLFGGEPLLKENLPIVEYIVEQALERGFTLSAVTNGYDLDHFTHLLGKDKIGSVQITIDGMPDMHNSKRIHRDGIPTFDHIIDNIKIALDNSVDVHIRFNTDKNNFSEIKSLKEYFASVGYLDSNNFSFDSARLDNYDNESDPNSYFSQKEFVKIHEKTNYQYNCKDFGTYSRLYKAISTGKPLPYKASFCGAQHGGLVFDPYFRLFPCWEIIGDNRHQIGTYHDGIIKWNEEINSRWTDTYVATIPECRTCRCALLCGGGCVAHNLDKHHCTCMADLLHGAAKRLYTKIQ